MNGIIISLALTYSIWSTNPMVDATIMGGYHVGPIYGTVSVETIAEERVFAWAYVPERVLYDFRLGARFDDIDFGLSRWCYHNVSNGNYAQPWGLSFFFRWSTW